MAWKQDLAKLKQQFGPETPAVARKAVPPPNPKPTGPAALDDEDAVFLSAMGLRPTPLRPVRPATAVEPTPSSPVAVPPPAPETFQDAVRDLKGLKPLSKDRPGQSSLPAAAAPSPPTAAPEAAQAPLQAQIPETRLPETPAPVSESQTRAFVPLRFQLAAGMAIEVDGALDLRGHSLLDATERLKDRLGDGVVLGWRSIQVTLGPEPALHEGLLALLTSGQTPMIARYAQAPVPMGGTQAWLLYFGPSPSQP